MDTAIVQTRDINIQVSSLLFDSIILEKRSYQYKKLFYKIVINTWTIYVQEQTFLISCLSMILPLYLPHGPNLHFFPHHTFALTWVLEKTNRHQSENGIYERGDRHR